MTPTIGTKPQRPAHAPRLDLGYLAQSTGSPGLVKIGQSHSPSQRIRSIRQSVPFPLNMIALFSNGRQRERDMKERFASLLYKGEWYFPGEEINSFLAETHKAEGVVIQTEFNETLFEARVRPRIEGYLDGRSPALTDGGDLVYRALKDGWSAIKDRLPGLSIACPKAFSQEFLHGYIPLDATMHPPRIAIPGVSDADLVVIVDRPPQNAHASSSHGVKVAS